MPPTPDAKRRVVLCILDGFGISSETRGNAIAAAKMPNYRAMLALYPHTEIGAGGEAVGLPPGQQGNSEVGHLNLGAGRVVYQSITRIDKAIDDGSFFAQSRPAAMPRRTSSAPAARSICWAWCRPAACTHR